MSLSVYTVKHPLVMNWTNYLLHNELTISDQFEIINKIGISLIYEATRKTIQINKLYLKEINDVVEVNILPNNINYLVFTDIYFAQILSQNIINLIPNSKVYSISNLNNNIFLQSQILQNNEHTHSILIKHDLDQVTIVKEINQILKKFPHINIKNIQVCCFMCKTSTLQFLGNTYPTLNIYTTQIINDNNN